MTKHIERKYLTIKDIQNEYLPIGTKKLRAFVKEHLHIKLIGGRIYVERAALEALLSCGISQKTDVD